jgi:hypothetical protein
MAWSTAQIQSQIRLHVGSATLDPVSRLAARLGSNSPTRLGSTRLGVARLEAGDVAGGSHCDDVLADWTLTCMLTVYTGFMMMSRWRHPYPGLARGSGRLVFGSGQLIRVKKTRVTRGARLCAWAVSSPAWRRVRRCPTFDFDAVFNSGFVSSSSTQWYGQNTILITFIFEQNQTPF